MKCPLRWPTEICTSVFASISIYHISDKKWSGKWEDKVHLRHPFREEVSRCTFTLSVDYPDIDGTFCRAWLSTHSLLWRLRKSPTCYKHCSTMKYFNPATTQYHCHSNNVNIIYLLWVWGVSLFILSHQGYRRCSCIDLQYNCCSLLPHW